MGRLAFLADEHVNRAYVTALRSNGFRVEWLDGGYDAGIDDRELLETANQAGLVTITNDEDFVELADQVDHAGIVMYHQYGHPPRAVVLAVSRIDRYLTAEEVRNHVEWLENWL